MATIEVVGGPDERRRVHLGGDTVTLGKSAGADVVIEQDTAVSRSHARLERVGGGWAIRDLGSTNGTFVNKERVVGDHALHDGDEIQLGRTHLVYRDPARGSEPATDRVAERPAITASERKVLVALCRPLLSGKAFSPPASQEEIADEVTSGVSTVKFHLGNLYAKFGISGDGKQSRRVVLANAAVESGVISIADLQSP
jgi:pSer/pThr/pTyr-binding forkhead associated (FHA) protein